ncbi:MAG: diguanylate cyclase [Planctomycetota bacterium]
MSAAAGADEDPDPRGDTARYGSARARRPPPRSGESEGEELERLYRQIADLDRENQHLLRILQQAGDVIITTDLEGKVTGFNEAAESLLGYTADEIGGRPATDFYARKAQRKELLQRLAQDPMGVVRDDVKVRTKTGKTRWLGISLSYLRDAEGQAMGTVAVSKDVTKRRELEDTLRRLSITDALTGLYNQSHFFHRLEVEKERALRLEHGLSLLLFDLDGFKPLNDTKGHLEGDQALRAIGRILFDSIRKEVDSAFRYGGDEFTVLLPGADVRQALAFAERVRATIEAASLHGVRASLGLAEFEPHTRGLNMLEGADASMYMAKKAGGNRIAYFDPDLGKPVLAPPGATA